LRKRKRLCWAKAGATLARLGVWSQGDPLRPAERNADRVSRKGERGPVNKTWEWPS